MNKETLPSVNETTISNYPEMSLCYIDLVMTQIIHIIATAESDAPLLFSKLYAKDGF